MIHRGFIILHVSVGYDSVAIVVAQNIRSDDNFIVGEFFFLSVNPGNVLILYQIQRSQIGRVNDHFISISLIAKVIQPS